MDRCEYPQILKFIDAKIPGFFEKYPGYKIFLLKLQYFSMILKEEPRDKIMHFFNKDLFPLLNKYAIKDLDQDYFDFKTLIEETNIIKCRTYKQAWKNACQIFMEGISLCFDNLFLIQENKNNSSIYNEYNKNKENFAKEVNTLFRFEKVINEYYKSYKSDEFHLYEPENIFSIRDNSDLDKEPLISFNLSDNSEESLSFFSGKNPFESNYKSDFIFEHKKIFINSKVYNKEKNNNKNQTNINDKKIESISINSNNISNKNKLKYKNETNPKLKSYKYDGRKKKIKEYKFKKVKRENLDKKILRKFKKFLKHSLREKTENEVKNYIKNNGFWPDYISMNLMPPFSYDKEKITFKSFNTQYLCWFFEHKFSLELFNIFIQLKYNDLLELIKVNCKLKEDSEDYNLLKVYLNSMPTIYGHDTRSTAFSSHIAESDQEEIKNNQEQISIEEENSIENNSNNENYKSPNKEDDKMMIDSENNKDDSCVNNDINFNYMSSNININNNNNNSGNSNDYINNDFTYINGNNSDINMTQNINMNEACEINNGNLNNSFERDNPNIIKLDKNLFNII